MTVDRTQRCTCRPHPHPSRRQRIGRAAELEYKGEVWDSPNSAGVIIDAIRAVKIAKDRGIGGPLISASSYLMKSPPEQFPDDQARDNVERFIAGELAR